MKLRVHIEASMAAPLLLDVCEWIESFTSHCFMDVVAAVSIVSDRKQQWYRNRNKCKYKSAHAIETLLHSSGSHQQNRKPYQAANQIRKKRCKILLYYKVSNVSKSGPGYHNHMVFLQLKT